MLLKMLKKLDHSAHFFEKGMQAQTPAQALIYLSLLIFPRQQLENIGQFFQFSSISSLVICRNNLH